MDMKVSVVSVVHLVLEYWRKQCVLHPPRKIRRAILYVPAGIKNAPVINSMSMMFPMIMYWITHEDRWLKKI